MNNHQSLNEIQEKLREIIPLISEKYRIDTVSIFGSFVREEDRSDSDLDILVSFHETPSLIEFVRLENCLSDQLGVKVDLVMKDALKKRIGKQILEEAISI